jgi:dephospho-CoA kinase
MVQDCAMNESPPTIGLTGGIGSGKSTIANCFKQLGCIVANADENAKKALQTQEVRAQLIEWWGNDILNQDGTVNTSAIASIVFEDKTERIRLESLLHPLARELQQKQFSIATLETNALIIDAPLLIEAGLDEICEAVVFVDVPAEIRQKRIKESRGWSNEEIMRRELAQLPLDMKRKRADYIVVNESDLESAKRQVEQILKDIQTRRLNKS